MRRGTLAGLLLAGATLACTVRGNTTFDWGRRPEPRYDIAYELAFPDPASHWYEIRLDVDGIRGDTVVLQLPVWSPGRYARMDFAKNVADFSASGDGGRALSWERPHGSRWVVRPAGSRTLSVRYRVFANTLSGTFSVLDTAHANWNGASLFMYVEGHKPDPVRLRVRAPQGWELVNGESHAPEQREFSFPDYDHLIDTPTEVAPRLDVDSFRVDGRLYRVMVHHNGSQAGQRARFTRDVERIVRYQNRVIAPPPLESYTFMFNVGYGGGDGMEHLYSTQIVAGRPWTDTAALLPGITTAAHEYFHVWNVKRIRPAVLGPFDYTTEQYQPSLWVAEGWTQYYGIMTIARAGVGSRDWVYRTLAGTLRYEAEVPARRHISARTASRLAPFWDGGAQPMATNQAETWVNYYTKGAALAMLLDLELRTRSAGAKSLDDVLRELRRRTWDAANESYYLQGRGYTEDDVVQAATAVAGTSMQAWFDRYVGGTAGLPWSEILPRIGLRLTTRRGADGAADYLLEDDPAANASSRALREGWLGGGS